VGRLLKQSPTLKDQISGSLSIPAGSTGARPADPQTGDIRYNTTTSNLEFYDGIGYQNAAVKGTVTITKDSFTGDGSTTVFILSITPADENNILVFVGNVHQNPDVAYTLTGSTLTFSSAPPDTQTIIVLHGFDSTSV
jgi:hypothetical protein